MKQQHSELANIDLAVLQIIGETGEASGYDINKIVDERGYRAWAGMGSSTVYVALKRLASKNLVQSRVTEKLAGRGPAPRKFRLNEAGKTRVEQETFQALSYPGSDTARFDLGVSGSSVLSREKVRQALAERQRGIAQRRERVEETYRLQGGDSLSWNVRRLFQNALARIERESTIVMEMMDEMANEAGGSR